MIFIKQPDGKIEQIETIDENDRVQKMRAYNLDKQLAEQQGKEYGTVYNDSESIPDEDKVTLGMMTQADYDEKQKERENAQIKAELSEIDIKSIRSIREYISKQADAPEYLKQYENEATEKRLKIKK